MNIINDNFWNLPGTPPEGTSRYEGCRSEWTKWVLEKKTYIGIKPRITRSTPEF